MRWAVNWAVCPDCRQTDYLADTPHLRAASRVTWCVDSPGFSLVGEKLRIPHAKPAGALLISAAKTKSPFRGFLFFGGEGGIRTLEEVAPLPDFESGRFSRSRTSPWGASI